METEGKVLEIKGDRALVEVRRNGACGSHCATCAGCGAVPMQVTARAVCPVTPGDWVTLSSPRGAVLFGMFVVFILPMLLPVAVYIAAMKTQLAGLWTALAVLLSLAVIWRLSRNKKFLAKSSPRIVSVVVEERKKGT